jgi:hypothetical protein
MMKKMMMMSLMNVHNSLMINRRSIEIFELMFDLLRFESNEIREFADLMMIEEIEIEHLEIVSLENESMQ